MKRSRISMPAGSRRPVPRSRVASSSWSSCWPTIATGVLRAARAGGSGAAGTRGLQASVSRCPRRRHNPPRMDLIIERRSVASATELDVKLHPVLRRAYAARGVRDSNELALTLDRMIPVGTLDSVQAAVALILEHRNDRILVIGDFDADGATSTALI